MSKTSILRSLEALSVVTALGFLALILYYSFGLWQMHELEFTGFRVRAFLSKLNSRRRRRGNSRSGSTSTHLQQ